MARTAAVDLLTVGEAFEDLVFFGLPRAPRSGEELRTSRFARTIGGGAVITAIAAARLGLQTGMVSALPEYASPILEQEGVRVHDVRRRGEPHAITVAISTRCDRSFVTFNGVNDAIEPRLAARIGALRARHVHFALAPSNAPRWIGIVDRLRASGTTTSWDFGWHPSLRRREAIRRLIASVDILFVNEAEARLYARARRDARATVVKLGARGSRWIADDAGVHAPAPRVRVVDTTGAGDAFNGGFLAAYLEGRSPRECLRRGNEVGARSITHAGGVTVRR